MTSHAEPFSLLETVVCGRKVKEFAGFRSTLVDRLEGSMVHGDREYIVFGKRRITYSEHLRLVESVASALSEHHGVRRGDRVAIAAANCPEWIITFWAAVRLGAIPVAFNAWWTEPELAHAVELTDPVVVVADSSRSARLNACDRAVIEIGRDFEALTGHRIDGSLIPINAQPDDAAVILFTSGTTGRAKGVVHTHRNIESYLGMVFYDGARRAASDAAGETGAARQLVTNPLFHVSGLHGAAIALLVSGATSVWHVGRFDAEAVLATIERERCTGWAFVPTTAARVVNHPRVHAFDLTSVRTIGGGGAPCSRDLLRRIREVFPNASMRVGVGYGLTESTALVSMIAGEELLEHADTVGRALPLVDLRICDVHGRQVPAGVEGEIVVRGPGVMAGYWADPASTAEAVDDDGWLHTGDIGWLDSDDYLHLVSRRTDLILRGGENVYPIEIEQCLEEHPAISEVAVVGLEHEDLGQEVAAIVVAKTGETLDTHDLEQWVRARLAYFKVPSRWFVSTQPLPRTSLGKLERHTARDRLTG